MAARSYGQYCGITTAVELIGERWAMLILRELAYGSRRFSELRSDLPGISANVLAQRLTELEQRNVMVAVCEANEKVTRKLIRMGLFKQIHGHRVFDSLQNAWESVSETLDHRAGVQKEEATPEAGVPT